MSSGDSEPDGGTDAENPSTPDRDPLDVDSAFAAIIAGWADAPATGSWPSQEDLSVGRHRRVDDPKSTDPDGGTGRRRSDPAAHDDSGDRRDDDDLAPSGAGPLIPSLGPPSADDENDVDDEADGFVPPDPPPLPRGDLVSRAAWAGLLIGPLFLLISVFVWTGAPDLLVLAAVAGFVGGFVTLVARMPSHRDDDDDDGAVV